MHFLHTVHVWLWLSLCLCVFYQPSLWVVTVLLLHLVGLFLQSLLWEQLAACHLSEKHYTYWCFNPSISHPSSLFPIYNLLTCSPFSASLSSPLLFFLRGWTSHSCSVKTWKVTALSDSLCRRKLSDVHRRIRLCYCFLKQNSYSSSYFSIPSIHPMK